MKTLQEYIRDAEFSFDRRHPNSEEWLVQMSCGSLAQAYDMRKQLLRLPKPQPLDNCEALRREISEMSITGRSLGADSVLGLHLEKWARRLRDALSPEPEGVDPPTAEPLRVVAINWTEHERGWGSRPDGHTLHRDTREALRYAESVTAGRDRGPVPDEYSSPGELFEVEVTAAQYAEVQSAGTIWGHVRQNLPEP